MLSPLAKHEVEQLMNLLNEEQRAFLDEHSKQSKKSTWIESLARRKGIVLDPDLSYEEMEALVDDWILVDILDSGLGNRNYHCECGRPLRYQYLVQHKKEDKTYGLGSKCFSYHTNLSPGIVKDIIDGFHTVDLERDEILVQFFRDRNEWDLGPFLYVDTIPGEYIVQFNLGLPLSMKQKAKVIKLKVAYDEARKYERTLASLTSLQRKVYDSLAEDDQGEVMDNLITSTDLFDRTDVADIPADEIEGELVLFLDVQLPLLERHKDIIREKRYELSRSIKETYLYNEFTASWGRNEPRRRITDHSLSIQELLDRHLPTLKRVREKEGQIPRGLAGDWSAIQNAVRSAQKGEEIDYVSFKVKLMNICFALHVEMDEYLWEHGDGSRVSRTRKPSPCFIVDHFNQSHHFEGFFFWYWGFFCLEEVDDLF